MPTEPAITDAAVTVTGPPPVPVTSIPFPALPVACTGPDALIRVAPVLSFVANMPEAAVTDATSTSIECS